MAVTCPECDNPLDIDPDEVEEGETITCDECGSEYDIISTEPLQIVPVDAEGYDDEDDDYGRESTDDEED
jgi:alpha-aminoadipate carrier protein LysW